MSIPKIGMRNIKTSFSVFLCLLIFEIINRDNSIYACVAAVICMQPTLENTYSRGLARLIGTGIGGLIGAVLLVLGEAYISEKAYIFLIPIGIIVLIELCVLLKQKEAVSISCIVFLSIMISQRERGDYYWHVINRMIDTSIGIILAIAVNKYLKVPRFLEKYIKQKKDNEVIENTDNVDSNEEK